MKKEIRYILNNKAGIIGLLLLLLMPVEAHSQDAIVLDTLSSPDNTESFLIKAQSAFNNRDVAKTKEYCLSAIELDPTNDAAYYLLSKVAFEEEDISSAEKFLSKAIEIDSTNYHYMTYLTWIYSRQNKINESVPIFEKLLKEYPDKKEAYWNLLNIYTNLGYWEKVFSVADKLEERMGPNEISVLARTNVYKLKGEMDNAIKELKDADDKSPSGRYEALLGDLYMAKRENTQALHYYKKSLESDSLYAPALYGVAEISRMKKDYTEYFKRLPNFLGNPNLPLETKLSYMREVLEDPVYFQRFGKQMSFCLNELADAHPKDTAAVTFAAMFMTGVGEKESAHKILQRGVRYNSDNLQFRLSYMSFLYTVEYWDELESFTDATLRNFAEDSLKGGDRLNVVQLKGIAEFNVKRYEKAIETFLSMEKPAKAAKDTSLLLSVYSSVGDMYHILKDNGTAYKFYKKALKINPKYAPVLNNYAWYIATSDGKRDLEKALKMSRITVECEPNNNTYLDTYAWILYLKGEYSEARKYLQRAVAYGGSESAVELEHYAEVLYALKEYDLSFIYFDRALSAAKAAEASGSADDEAAKVADLERKIGERKKAANIK